MIHISNLSIIKQLINSNTTPNVSASQGVDKRFKPIDPQQYSNPQEFFSKLSTSKLKVLSYLLKLSKIYNVVCPSQDSIARGCGIGRQYVNTVLQELRDLGLIAMDYRHRRTCRYYLAKIFRQDKVQSILRRFFTAISNGARAIEMVYRKRIMAQATPLDLKSLFYRILNSKFDYRREIELVKSKRLNPTVIESHTLRGSEMQPTRREARVIKTFHDLHQDEQQEISVYPKRAIDHAIKQLSGKPVFSPLDYLRKACHEFITSATQETPETGKTKPVLQPHTPPIPYDRNDSRTPRQKQHAYFVEVMTSEGQRYAQMLVSQQLDYCKQVLVSDGWKEEDIDRQWPSDRWMLIREAKTVVAERAVDEYRKRNGWPKDVI